MKALLAAAACAALATVSFSAPTLAADKAASETTAKKPEAKKDPNRMVCKKTAVTGSRFPIKSCRTAADWEKQAELDKQDLDNAQRSGLATCGTNPCS
ncbi:MAG: hypothetical protein GC145_08310 [Caulobacter sp.]|nr:hypothetical protein [Caulobacter sp.]